MGHRLAYSPPERVSYSEVELAVMENVFVWLIASTEPFNSSQYLYVIFLA
jgi:hypothetical protein